MSITLNARTCRLLAITTLGILCGLTLAAVRAPAVATEADTATPMRFSEVREHVLSIGSLKFLLDLDTDETMDPPARNRIEQAQMDIHPAQQQPSERPTGLLCDSSFLTGSPLRGIRVTPADWNTSASELQDTFASDTAQPLTELEYQANESATYFFRTSDGTDGILQLMEIIENSPDLVGRDTQGIRVRYKVLEAVAEAETSQADGTTKPLDRQASEREHSSEPAETEMLAPREPLAESDVAALLVVSRDETSRQMTESVEWRPCVAVRAVFDCLENSRRLARRLGRSRTDVTEELQIIDFELQRQSWAEGESEWSGWQPVDIAYARELLQRSAGFDDDSVAAGARDAAITMPLPARAIGEWDASLVTHPAIRAEPAEGPDEGAGDELLLRYLDFDVTGGNRIRYRMRIEFGVARETVWTDWSEPTREVTVPAAGDGVQRGLLDVSRSIVRIETAVDGELRSGSGVLVTGSAAKEHGMQSILTSAHLLNGFDAGRHVLNVQLFDEVTPRTRALDYVSIEEDAGLALLCFSDLEQNLPTASIAPLQRRPDVGDDATFHWWIDGRLPAMFSTHRVVAVDRYAGPSNLECTGLPQPGQPSGGLFNARLELIGICVAADPEAGRGVFTALPAILEFLDIDGEPADERRAPQPASPTNPYGLPVTGSPIGLSGPPHVPVGGPGPGALHPADVESTVILIALGADDAGALTDIHYLTELLGTGDDAVDALTTRLAAAAEESAAAQRALHVQISVDPRLKYASVARIMDVCREQGAADVRLALLRPDDDFVINIGFVRDGEGRKLSETPVVFWEDRVRGVDDLSGILRTERQQRPGADVTVVLRADSDVPGGVIQDVIRQAQEAGFEKFVLRVLHADAHPPELHGTVLEVMETSGGVVVQISIGHDDGLRRGDRLDVLRGDSVVNRERVGLIEITHVSAEHSVARVLEFQADAPIARGDQIVAGTDSRYPRNLSRLIPVGDEHPLAIQLHIQESAGLQVHWTDPVSGESEHLTAPCRVNVTPGLLALTLTDIPGRSGLLLRSTIETPVATPATSAWLEHNAVPIELTDEDFAQVESGNFVVKVIYLPNPGLRETAVAGVETLVSTRLDPGVDPVEEAEQRGTVLAVVRLGSRAEP